MCCRGLLRGAWRVARGVPGLLRVTMSAVCAECGVCPWRVWPCGVCDRVACVACGVWRERSPRARACGAWARDERCGLDLDLDLD